MSLNISTPIAPIRPFNSLLDASSNNSNYASLSSADIAILCALSLLFSDEVFIHDASSLHCCHNADNAKLDIFKRFCASV